MKQPTSFSITFQKAHETPTYHDVVNHEILDLRAGTYHRLTFPNKVVLYINDFGVQSVLVVPKGVETPL